MLSDTVCCVKNTDIPGACQKGAVNSRKEEPHGAGQNAEKAFRTRAKHSSTPESIAIKALGKLSRGAKTINFFSQPNIIIKKHSNLDDNQCKGWTRNVHCSLLLNRGPTPCCFLKHLVCMACPDQKHDSIQHDVRCLLHVLEMRVLCAVGLMRKMDEPMVDRR